jgi:hypothetical protein
MGFTEEWATRFAANLAEEIKKVVPVDTQVTCVGVTNAILASVSDKLRLSQTFILFSGLISAERHLFVRYNQDDLRFVSVVRKEFEMQDPNSIGELIMFMLNDNTK